MVLLVKPESVQNGFSLDMALKTEPLELEYIKAMLAEYSIDSCIYEADFDPESFEQILSRLKPAAVAVTGYITQERLMLSYAKLAKAFDSKIITIIGGPHSQLNPKPFFQPEVSYICRSDNIYALAHVLEYEGIIKGQKPSLETVDGLCFPLGCTWQVNPLAPFDLNKLPFPDRSQFSKYEKHYRYLDVSPVALIKTSSSCPYDCSFCYGRSLNCHTYFQRDVSKVVAEIETISCKNIQIADDDFLFDVPRLTELIRLIRERRISKTFICYGRADFIATHPALMKELSSVGFRYIMVGLEAVNDSFLKSYQKHSSQEINRRTISLLRELDINLVGLFIIDLEFTSKDFRNMRRFIRRQKIIYTGVSIFTPIPGTALYKQYENRLLTHNREKWDFMHLVVQPVHMSRFHFYLEYYLLVMDLFRIASRAGIYSFLKLKDYKNIFLKLLFTDSFFR